LKSIRGNKLSSIIFDLIFSGALFASWYLDISENITKRAEYFGSFILQYPLYIFRSIPQDHSPIRNIPEYSAHIRDLNGIFLGTRLTFKKSILQAYNSNVRDIL